MMVLFTMPRICENSHDPNSKFNTTVAYSSQPQQPALPVTRGRKHSPDANSCARDKRPVSVSATATAARGGRKQMIPPEHLRARLPPPGWASPPSLHSDDKELPAVQKQKPQANKPRGTGGRDPHPPLHINPVNRALH